MSKGSIIFATSAMPLLLNLVSLKRSQGSNLVDDLYSVLKLWLNFLPYKIHIKLYDINIAMKKYCWKLKKKVKCIPKTSGSTFAEETSDFWTVELYTSKPGQPSVPSQERCLTVSSELQVWPLCSKQRGQICVLAQCRTHASRTE